MKSVSRLRLSDDWRNSCDCLDVALPKDMPHLDKEEPPYEGTPVAARRSHSTSTLCSKNNQTISSPTLPPVLSTPRSIPSQSNHRSPFLSILPSDIHYVIAIEYLDLNTLLALRQTCRFIHSLLTPSLVQRVRFGLILDSLDSEARQYANYRSVYPRQRLGHLWDLLYAAFDFRLIERPARELRCYGCLEVKPLWCFVERMSSRGTGLGAKFASDRMCKECMRRFRDVEGTWWKENWIKKSDTRKKFGKATRLKGWLIEGKSLINPDEEVGVCGGCGNGSAELYWGCQACFELEEKRRRDEDLEEFTGVERTFRDIYEIWRVRKEANRRAKQASRERRGRTRWMPRLHLNLSFDGTFTERKEALALWRASKEQAHKKTKAGDGPWKAIEQVPLPKTRRVAKCSSCWVPNCPRRTYILGMAYERPLSRDQWCPGCQNEHDERQVKKRAARNRTAATSSTIHDDGIFSDDWDNGLGTLFDEE